MCLDDGTFGREIADREAGSGSHPVLRRRIGRKNHPIRIHAIALQQQFAQRVAAFGIFPRIELLIERPPLTVRAFVSSRPARRKCSIASGTPPAMKT